MAMPFSQKSQSGMNNSATGSEEEVYIFPVSFCQERLWFLDQFEPGSPFYNIISMVGLPGSLNLDALKRTIDEILRRHEVLRTTFAILEGRPVQVIAPSLSLDLPIIDLRRLSKAERQREVSRLASEDIQRPFDLARGPLLRTTLLRLAEQDHLLLLTMHHIVSDGWSMGIFFNELTVLYQAYCSNKESPLPELAIQYADFAQWQREQLQGERLEQLLGYWSKQLADAPAILDLPTDHARPAVQSFKGATHTFTLGAELMQGVKETSQQARVTLFMSLLAAFKVLLYRYTGQEDIVVGTPIANRNRGEIEALIGFFVNTLVLRTDLRGNPRFREVLARVKEVTLGAYEHQDLPFEKLVEELQPERHLNHNPVFQVLFSLKNMPEMRDANPEKESTGTQSHIGTGTSKFDLALFTEEMNEGLFCGIEYNTDLFDAETIERMQGHYERLLEAIVSDPDERISQLQMLRESEQEQLLYKWNDTSAEMGASRCAHEMFEHQVERRPKAVAVKVGDKEISYGELDRRANQMGRYLRKLGVGPEVKVGIKLGRTEEMMVSVLGVLKAGGAYVPLDPGYPRERLAYMIKEAGMEVLICEEGVGEEVSVDGVVEVRLGRDREEIRKESEGKVESGAEGESLAYVIYTSGSTGKPKGVAMPHRALANLISWQTRNSDHGARALQFASLSFDVSFQEMFTTWCSGGTLVLAAEESRRDPVKLFNSLKEAAVERLFLPPVVLQQLAETLGDSMPPASLKEIITAGEQLQITQPIARLFEKSRNCALRNHYGPSESHVVTEFILQGPSQGWPTFPPIGRPIANAQIYLLDSYLHPVPVGVPGELYIGGIALARGYINRPEMTAERFIPDPFGDKPGQRLYKTGDLARYLIDGNIEFIGRLDHQVKVRGFRIEMGEIEAVLRQHTAVQEAVALVRKDSPGDNRIVAYLVTHKGSAPSTSELHRFLREKLPDYMIPSAFVLLDALPLSRNGKIDRRALPAPDRERPTLERAFVAPRNALEDTLAKIWTEVLGVERVGIHDNFFELGGHSLLATQVSSRVRDSLDMELPLRLLFEAPTIAELAVGIVCSRFKLAENDDLTQLLTELEQLSEEEARAILAEES